MKRDRIIMISIYSFLVLAVIAFIFILNMNKYSASLVMDNDGYAINRDTITKNLFSTDLDMKATYDAVGFQSSDIIYQKGGNYYIGNDKTQINTDFPLFVNSGATVMNLTDEINLITDNFETVKSYSGLYVSNGLSYNPDMEQAYRENFNLLSLVNGLYINTKPIVVQGSFFVKQTIPVNSVIRFMEHEIRYYFLDNGEFIPNVIKSVNEASVLSIDHADYGYYDFLEKLGLYEKTVENKTTPTSTPSPTPTLAPQATQVPMQSDYVPETGLSDYVGFSTSNQNEDMGRSETNILRSPTATDIPKKLPDSVDKPSKPQDAQIAPSPTQAVIDNEMPVATPKPAKLAPPALAPEEIPTSEPPLPNMDQPEAAPTDMPVDDDKPVIKDWKQPTVKLGVFSTSVYSILCPGMVVENSEFLYRTGIGFSIYEGTKLVMKKTYLSSNDVKIGPLKPDTDYHVEVQMDYVDKYGAMKTQEVTKADVHTKPLSDLVPIRLNWTNGQIYYSKIQLTNFTITDAVSSTDSVTGENTYIETVQYMNRMEVNITSQTDSSVKYSLPVTAKDLVDLRTGKSILYNSPGKIASNTEYEYTFKCYDRFGNLLPMDGSLIGSTHTCKQPPKADISILKNEVKNIELSISVQNPDNATISEGSLYFCVYDKNNNPVSTTITRKDKSGNKIVENEIGDSHAINLTGDTIQFSDLLDYEVYSIRVFCNYDINDNVGVYEYTTIGETSFTTTPIATLGYAFFNVVLQKVDDESATVEVTFDTARTNNKLVSLINDIDFSIADSNTKDGTGINVTYYRKGEAAPVEDDSVVNNGKIAMEQSDIALMKAWDGSTEADKVTYVFRINKLKSNTDYSINIIPKVTMGSGEYAVSRNIDTFFSPNKFKTMKKSPVIDIDAIYASESFIQLYGVSVNDPDVAVIGYPVNIYVYDDEQRQVASFKLTSKNKAELIDIQKLKKNVTYTIRFFATEYNNGNDMTTYRKNYELFYSELFEAKDPLRITTKEAITGTIEMQQLNSIKKMATQEILAKNITSYNKSITLYQNYRFSSNNQIKAKFSLNTDFGTDPYNSFQIGFSYVNRATQFDFYTVDPDTNPGAQAFAGLLVDGLTRGSEYCRWTDVKFFNNNQTLTGVQKIYIVASTVDKTGGIDCLWGIRFHKAVTTDNQHYYADLNTMVSDARGELGNLPSYQIKVFEDGAWVDTRRHEWTKNADGSYTLRMYKIAPDQSETLVDIKTYKGEDRISNTDFYYEVEKGHHTYRFELWAVVFDYQIQLDKVDFTTEKEIAGIRTADDLMDVRYGIDKKYYVLNDITCPSNYNNITNNQVFNGELDFRGHTLKYNNTGNLISTIGFYGSLKNLVFTYVDGYGRDTEKRGNRIVSSNYGTIQNILLLRNNGNVAQTYYSDAGAICYTNYESGIIENFVAKDIDPYFGGQTYAVVCALNRGTIRNGYIYGAPMIRTPYNSNSNMTIDQYTSNILTGGIVAVNRQSGTVENVYSLVDIQTRENLSVNDYAFGLIGLNDGTIRNSFYTGDVTYGGKTWTDYGPAYRNRYSAAQARNVYYYSPVDYGKTTNTKIAKMVLYDAKWYDRLFNRSGSSVSGQFDLGPLAAGCYPHVIWPDLMPDQEYIDLPELTDEDQLKILDTEITEQGDDYAKAVITFENPDEFPITKINAQWLNTEILSQEKDGDFYRVTVRMSLAPETKYYSAYNITSFSYRIGSQGIEKSMDYAVGSQPVVYAEFYKPITSTAGWSAIKDDYKQNYRLYADLNFQFLDPKIPVLPANVTQNTGDSTFAADAFSGKLDGNNHKLTFVDTGTYGYVIGKLKGTVKNLTIQNLDARAGTSQFKGFIGRMLEGSLVDNVHVFDMQAVSFEQCGAIAGDVFASTIINSSAHNISIETTAEGNFTQYVGGLVGKHRITSGSIYANLVIQNSYVDGLTINVKSAADCGGVGGLVGYIRASAEISHVYVVNGTIDTVYKNVGGLIGGIDTYTNSESNLYMLKDYYVDVDISSVTERCGGIIGFSTVANAELEEHGLVLGNTVTSLPNPTEVGRYYGYNTLPSGKIYSYEGSILNGKLNTDSTLLTYSKLCDPTTYQIDGPLYWDNDFVANTQELAQGILPKLKRTDKDELLPYQNDYHLENNPIKIKSIGSKNYSSGDLYTVQIEASHPADITITGATFRGLLPADLGGEPSVTITDDGNVTTLKYVLGIEGYYDSYYMTGITYTQGTGGTTKTQSMYLNVGILPQYLKIGSIDEWNTLMAKERYGQKGCNVQITGNLDFTSYGSAASNVTVNHLMGGVTTPGSWYTIKGITMDTGEPLIKAAYGNISYLSFENITYKKTSTTSPTLVNNFGLISSITGNMHDVSFKNCTVDTYNSCYSGIAALSYGKNYNITMNGVKVYDTYNTTPAKLGVGGLIGRLSGSGAISNTNASNLIVQGRHYVGGVVGIQDDGRNFWNINVDNAVVYSNGAGYNYVGGIAGYANTTSLEDIFGYCSVKRSVVAGSAYVGGIIGTGSVTGNSHHTSLEKDKWPNLVQQSFVIGTNAYIGGAAGQGVVHRTVVKSSSIYGPYNIGGVTGNGAAIFDSCLDSTISTVYDRTNSSDTTNTAFVSGVNSWISNYNSLITGTADQLKKNVYNEANTVLSSFITTARINAWKTFTGNNNTRIGGISARTISATDCITANCKIGAYGAISVGGTVARTELSSYNNGPYRIMACGVQNSEIYGAEDIGGIVGSHLRSYIESSYSNANVTATLDNAGGIAGRIKATSLYSLSETPYIGHVYYAGTATAPTYVAGIAGKMEQPLYNINEGWLMAGNVKTTSVDGVGNYFLNKQNGDGSKITKALIYENSTITFGSTSQAASAYYLNNPALLIRDDIAYTTTAEMKTKTTYTDKMLWTLDTGTTSSNYSTRYWNYNGLTNGYMPYLLNTPGNNYDMASAVHLQKYQEGYVPDITDPTKAAVDSEGQYLYKYEKYNGGVPIPGSGAGVVKARMMALKSISATLPRAEFYTVDADKLNIEFNQTNENASFTVEADGVKVAEGKINQRVFTLTYDFRSELAIKVTDGSDELKYSVLPEDVSRNIMTWGADYYYIASNQISGSNPGLNGQFVNLYAGHALDASGSVYDVQSGRILRKTDKISLASVTVPLHSFNFEGYQLQTFKNYTLVGDLTREKLRMYVKNNELSAISNSLAAITDSLILDDYNGSKYCSVLSTDGTIMDMTDSKLNIPDKFINSDIQYMTNNLDSTEHIVLVRYYDGAVAGFNYITGELLPIESPRGATTDIVDNFAPSGKSKNVSMTNFATLYVDAMDFSSKLTDIGWAEVNGTNIIDGDAVSTETGVLDPDNNVAMYVEDTFTLDDGTVVKLNPDVEAANAANKDNKDVVVTWAAGQTPDRSDNEDVALGNSEEAQEVIDAIASIQASINVVQQTGATQSEIDQIQKQINDLGNMGVPSNVIQELNHALSIVIDAAKAAGKPAGSALNSNKNTSGNKTASDQNKGGKADSTTNSKSDRTNPNKQADAQKQQSGLISLKDQYIPVYDTKQSKYVLYDVNDLLKAKDKALKTVNKKVEESGHMIDYRSRQKADSSKADDDNLYGFLLLAAAITGIAVLLGALMFKKSKEADK